MHHLRLFYYFFLVIICSSCGLTSLILFIKKKDKASAHFLIFTILNIILFSLIFLETYIRNSKDFPLSLQWVWRFSFLLDKLRFFFLIYFLHSLEKNLWPGWSDYVATFILGLGFFIFPLFFPAFPRIMMGGAMLYVFGFTGYRYLLKKSGPAGKQILWRNLFILALLCGVLMAADLLEELPLFELRFAVLIIDLYPLLPVGLCAGYTLFLAGNHFTPVSTGNKICLRESGLVEYRISSREKEIMQLIISGHSNAEIAEKLFIAPSTVKKHIHSIFKKMNINSRWQLLKLCREGVSPSGKNGIERN